MTSPQLCAGTWAWRNRLRPRTTFLNLPDEILLAIHANLHCTDLVRMREVHSRCRDLIDNNPSLWAKVQFDVCCWPSTYSLESLFIKAGSYGNVEALIKLAVAYLYNEGYGATLSEGVDRCQEHGWYAAKLFIDAELANTGHCSFTWLFMRPPWPPMGNSIKISATNAIRGFIKNSKTEVDPKVYCCLANVLNFNENEPEQKESLQWFEKAAELGSSEAFMKLWAMKHKHIDITDNSAMLESIRRLRECAVHTESVESRLTLCNLYADGHRGGYSRQQTDAYIRHFMQNSPTSHRGRIFNTQKKLRPSMWYILVDWLVEVTEVKDFSPSILYASVSLLERYLVSRPITRKNLQLAGIAAVVICSRYIGSDIMTIREAAWLTDNSYVYIDVVKFISEMVGVTKGHVKSVTVLNYVELLLRLHPVDKQCENLTRYICESTLLHTAYSRIPTAVVACSALCLSGAILHRQSHWPPRLVACTGFETRDLVVCMTHLHRTCLIGEDVADDQGQKLFAVKLKYSELSYDCVAKMDFMSLSDLGDVLGVDLSNEASVPVARQTRSQDQQSISFQSPTRKMTQHDTTMSREELLTTPIGELSIEDSDNDIPYDRTNVEEVEACHNNAADCAGDIDVEPAAVGFAESESRFRPHQSSPGRRSALQPIDTNSQSTIRNSNAAGKLEPRKRKVSTTAENSLHSRSRIGGKD